MVKETEYRVYLSGVALMPVRGRLIQVQIHGAAGMPFIPEEGMELCVVAKKANPSGIADDICWQPIKTEEYPAWRKSGPPHRRFFLIIKRVIWFMTDGFFDLSVEQTIAQERLIRASCTKKGAI